MKALIAVEVDKKNDMVGKKVINVEKGTVDTDAVTFKQLNDLKSDVASSYLPCQAVTGGYQLMSTSELSNLSTATNLTSATPLAQV